MYERDLATPSIALPWRVDLFASCIAKFPRSNRHPVHICSRRKKSWHEGMSPMKNSNSSSNTMLVGQIMQFPTYRHNCQSQKLFKYYRHQFEYSNYMKTVWNSRHVARISRPDQIGIESTLSNDKYKAKQRNVPGVMEPTGPSQNVNKLQMKIRNQIYGYLLSSVV